MITEFKIFENNNNFKINYDIDKVLVGYINVALWIEEDRYFDENIDIRNYSIDDFTEEEKTVIKIDIRKFFKLLETELEKIGDKNIIRYINRNLDEETMGYDLWLTRNGHGSGFWSDELFDIEFIPDNNPYGKPYNLGEIMSQIAEKMGVDDLYFEKPYKDKKIKQFKI